MDDKLPDLMQVVAFSGYALAAIIMLLVTQTKERVAWPGWLVPAAMFAAFAAWTCVALLREDLHTLWSMVSGSFWGVQLWYDFLISLTAAFFLLQNRARAAGMKSEIWVLLVIFTGSIGLMLMLARTLYLERKAAA